jgi:hypothetical protein
MIVVEVIDHDEWQEISLPCYQAEIVFQTRYSWDIDCIPSKC